MNMKSDKKIILYADDIKNRIYTIRNLQVMLDKDLAELYHVKTKALNQAVKRNITRFPENFMFKITDVEKNELVTKCDHLKQLKFSSNTPYVFTEQGVAMLSGILKSDAAVRISIQIMNAFVAMRKFIASNAQIFQRLDTVEKKQFKYDEKLEKIFDAIETNDIKPKKGIFFDGQIFDSYRFVSDIIRSARESIILIDNYIDDSVLTLFNKRKKDVIATIFTKEISEQLSLDLKKYNSQYNPITIKKLKYFHDRFLIIDDKETYHFGASLKDLGKKWFAFSKFDKETFILLEKLELSGD